MSPTRSSLMRWTGIQIYLTLVPHNIAIATIILADYICATYTQQLTRIANIRMIKNIFAFALREVVPKHNSDACKTRGSIHLFKCNQQILYSYIYLLGTIGAAARRTRIINFFCTYGIICCFL
jgi:hypothetical protein